MKKNSKIHNPCLLSPFPFSTITLRLIHDARTVSPFAGTC